ncbi:MAG: Tol-Pal system protein TolB, partial [Pseudomonadota bacterium]
MNAQLSVEITQGTFEPIRLAVPIFSTSSTDAGKLNEQITKVIRSDLESTGLFKTIAQDDYLETFQSIDTRPRFANWRPLKAAALIQGEFFQGGDGSFEVRFRLWDIFAENQMLGHQFRAKTTQWRRVAHIIADKIYERLTGEQGYFDTRILYIAESGPADKRIKRLALMDYDGYNHKFLTDGRATAT